MTWDRIGYIEVTPVSLKFWRQFDSNISVDTYKKGSSEYNVLTDYARDWANKIILQLAKATPDDYVLPEFIHRETGEPYGPRGMIRSLAAALGVIDAYKGLMPPNWGHPTQNLSANENPVGRRAVNDGHDHRSSPVVYHQQSYDQDSSVTATHILTE